MTPTCMEVSLSKFYYTISMMYDVLHIINTLVILRHIALLLSKWISNHARKKYYFCVENCKVYIFYKNIFENLLTKINIYFY